MRKSRTSEETSCPRKAVLKIASLVSYFDSIYFEIDLLKQLCQIEGTHLAFDIQKCLTFQKSIMVVLKLWSWLKKW